ncbi:hypothetical protein [Kitasatospora camelliae]|uniref:Uncharacterized protein n=1 Tax=Kitasatospora camelliae TaxID=3156397 RepID=A0AAU8JYZ5_9ACTN
MSDLFEKNGVVDRLLAVACLGVSLMLLDLGVDHRRHGGSIGWAVPGAVLVLVSCYATVRRFRARR